MTIIQFPGKFRPPPRPLAPQRPVPKARAAAGSTVRKRSLGYKVARALTNVLWCVVIFTWPLLEWVLSMDVLFQFLRMLYYSGTPGMHAGWTFTMHFLIFIGLYFFMVFYKAEWR